MKPILFSDPMVRAITEGRKTVTRRVIKPQPLFKTTRKFIFDDDVCPQKWKDCSDITAAYRYQPGDVLWVRESWLPYDNDHIINGVKYAYKTGATDDSERLRREYGYRWRPAIFMPREAARLFLQVTGVRVERLQDITLEECVAEGVECEAGENSGEFIREKFRGIWDAINARRNGEAFTWDKNPWVWAVTFRRINPEQLREDSK